MKRQTNKLGVCTFRRGYKRETAPWRARPCPNRGPEVGRTSSRAGCWERGFHPEKSPHKNGVVCLRVPVPCVQAGPQLRLQTPLSGAVRNPSGSAVAAPRPPLSAALSPCFCCLPLTHFRVNEANWRSSRDDWPHRLSQKAVTTLQSFVCVGVH